MQDTLGWSISDWLDFHKKFSPEKSYSTLLSLIKSQAIAPENPAWISVASDSNLQTQWQVLQTRRNKESLPLYGVPVAIKDNIDANGFLTTAACPSFAYTPNSDSTVVNLLRDAGAIIIGKTNLDQFATGLVGTRSPYGKVSSTFSDKHVSGGSSAGSARVVADGIVPIALGTDTAGSGRVPAALNNLIGLKPTKGVFSCSGVVPACKSLDCVSIFTLNLSDAEICFKILCQSDPEKDEYSRDYPQNPLQKFSKNVTIAIPKVIPWYSETENPKLYANAVQKLRQTGANVKELDLEPLLELACCLYEGPWVSERYAAVGSFMESNPPNDTLDPTVKKIIEGGKDFKATDFFKFEYKRQRILKKVDVLLDGIDVVCVPTCPLNPTIEDVEKEPILVNSRQGTWTNFVNLADLAALAIPAGFRSDGLPNGITLLGKKFTDYALLDLASRFLDELYPRGSRPFGSFKDKCVNDKDSILQGPPRSTDLTSFIKLAVVGAHLKGLPLHWQLEQVNAKFISSVKTTNKYKLYALPKNGPILKPGLARCPDDTTASSIVIELYSVPTENFGRFISMVPEPLGIGSVELESGEWVKSFICEEVGYKAEGSVDITSYGGFKSYIEHLSKEEQKIKKPFNSVLIANRGEIAVRIIKTLRKLKIKSIAIYSDPDQYSEHVTSADISIPLHGSTASETYLDIEKIIKAAKETGAEAIIPGYGFLSENANFADICEKEGITFVGPSGDIIRSLGLKHSAREIARQSNVPLVPGTSLIRDVSEAKEAAEKIGFPVMVKSTAGGGGIGLKRVDSADELESIFATVQHQGASYFGNSGVFLEKFIENARHVEIQIMGDGRGNAIALSERDCSLQRRNQKVIEETPAPNLSDRIREELKVAAESLARQLKYKTAGTVEFIYDEGNEAFYFLEVNTRLQVEHPVTEMVTGLDLVEMMLRIAADDPPDFDKFVLKLSGASMEARLYAENPLKDFRPSPGQLVEVEFPSWARVDTWVKKGTVVSSEYDPLIAKIIVHGKDRKEALAKLNLALNETNVYGCVTNIGYLRSIASSAMFRDVQLSTNLLNTYSYDVSAFEILTPGAHTSIQDYPGRKGYWRIGVPPSGPMDCYSFRLANRIVGNDQRAAAIEITLIGPSILFHANTVIALTGGTTDATLNGSPIEQFNPINVHNGDKLFIGKMKTGCRAYLAIRGSIDVPDYLGSKSTFTLGEFGGYNGRVLKTGDVLFLKPGDVSLVPEATPKSLIPTISHTKEWKIGVTCGPHGSPDFFKEESIKDFFNKKWEVHYNSNRFGVRLIGPKPKWARNDGGEGGLHPSNAHDYVYSIGAINFTGDEPVILTCDGPSLGGFVCQAVVPEAELWKVGQVKQGDLIQFVPLSYDSARILQESQDNAINNYKDGGLIELTNDLVLSTNENPILLELPKQSTARPKVIYRQAGDRYILVEYGEISMDFNLSYRIHSLIKLAEKYQTIGIVEMSQGVRSVLIEFDGYKTTQQILLKTLVAYESEIYFEENWKVESKIFRLPITFEDSKTVSCVTRYEETIRSKAPWLPNNVDFIADINQITRNDVRDMVYSAKFMVLGLGDVFLGSPCAVPMDPRQRFLGSKYNPSRSYTDRGLVGLGGMYMCIYAAGSPGGYQLVGRTIPIWDKLSLLKHSRYPWLLSPFDQVEFYPVDEEQLNNDTNDWDNGAFEVEVENTTFDYGQYLKWIDSNKESIDEFRESQTIEMKERFTKLIEASDIEVKKSKVNKAIKIGETYPDNSELIYSEFAGRFWKNIVSAGDSVKMGEGLIVIEAMKTEMVVTATVSGKVLKVLHMNGDIVNSGDLVAVIENVA